jgi:hypothetical protein
MTIHNLYIFDRHCQCIYFQKWTHNNKSASGNTNLTSSANGTSSNNNSSQLGNSSSRLGGLATTANSSSRFSTSSAASSSNNVGVDTLIRSGEDNTLQSQTGITQQSGLAAGSVISIEEEAKLVYGVVLSLRNFVRKLSGK